MLLLSRKYYMSQFTAEQQAWIALVPPVSGSTFSMQVTDIPFNAHGPNDFIILVVTGLLTSFCFGIKIN